MHPLLRCLVRILHLQFSTFSRFNHLSLVETLIIWRYHCAIERFTRGEIVSLHFFKYIFILFLFLKYSKSSK